MASVVFLVAAHAQAACVPGSEADWMRPDDRIHPQECAAVERTPPQFAWPALGGDTRYFVTLTYPDGHQRTRTARRNWIHWDEVLPAGVYSWTVQASTPQGVRASRARQFIVGPEARPFLVPAGPTLLAAARGP